MGTSIGIARAACGVALWLSLLVSSAAYGQEPAPEHTGAQHDARAKAAAEVEKAAEPRPKVESLTAKVPRDMRVAEDGAKVAIVLRPLEAEPKATEKRGQEAGASPERAWQQPMGITLIGPGGAGAAAGALLGGLGVDKKGERNEEHRCDAQGKCDSAGLNLRSEAVKPGNASPTAMAAGASLLAGGIVLYKTAPQIKQGERAGARGAQSNVSLRVGYRTVQLKGVWVW